MRLDLRFSDRPLENIWCQAVVALVFEGPYLTRGNLSGLNEKMAGFLTHIEEKRFWTGMRGETVLLASQNKIKAEKILLKGLGETSCYDTYLLADRIKEVSSVLDKLAVNEFAIHVPIVEGLETQYLSHLEVSALHLVIPFLEKYHNDSNFILKIIFSVEKYFTSYLTQLVSRLREQFSSQLDFSIVVGQ